MTIRQTVVGLVVLAYLVMPSPAHARAEFIYSYQYSNWPFPHLDGGSLYCKDLGGGRKAVWMNGADGTYALNGQAMDWSARNDLLGADGAPWKIGRDHSNNPTGLGQLIQQGLTLCD